MLVQAERTQVYRGRRLADGQPVILKTNTNEYPTPAETARLKHEFDFNQQLNLPGVIRVLELVQHGSRTWLVVEDIGGESLKGLLEQGRVDLEGTLQIAVQVVQVLGQLHQRNIVHRDVKPHNLIVNVKTWEARLTDFEHASVLDRESQAITSPDRIEGTLAYMSPEQTGRMNRAIDYRTDFYSLGVTLYQALTGVLPFEAHDPMEWVHCHIARTPEPPHARNAAVPEAVSAIVMKLLAKTAEERYQSAYGLRRDLEACLTRIRAGTSLAGFVPAQHDSSEKFQIPQQLYGRDAERAELLRMFKRVAEGSTGMMLICGYSGIGKSALVNEVQKPIVEERGYFTSGKFDQFERGVPYSAFIRAFTELLRQILTSDEAVLGDWRKDLLKALGPNAQVVVEVIPELEAIIGQQPPVPYLPPAGIPEPLQARLPGVCERVRPGKPSAGGVPGRPAMGRRRVVADDPDDHVRPRQQLPADHRRLPRQRGHRLAPAHADARRAGQVRHAARDAHFGTVDPRPSHRARLRRGADGCIRGPSARGNRDGENGGQPVLRECLPCLAAPGGAAQV